MTGTGGGVVMLVGGGLMGAFGGLLFANRDGYTREYIEDQRLRARDRPPSEVQVALMRLMGLLLAAAGAVVFVVGLVLTVRGQGRLPQLLSRHPQPVWLRLPPLGITAVTLGQLAQACRRRPAPWTGRMWAAAAVLAVGALGFAAACWWGFVPLGIVLLVAGLGVFLAVARHHRAATAERPRSPEIEGEQGRSEP